MYIAAVYGVQLCIVELGGGEGGDGNGGGRDLSEKTKILGRRAAVSKNERWRSRTALSEARLHRQTC